MKLQFVVFKKMQFLDLHCFVSFQKKFYVLNHFVTLVSKFMTGMKRCFLFDHECNPLVYCLSIFTSVLVSFVDVYGLNYCISSPNYIFCQFDS